MKVSELTGAELDFWVAKAEGKLRDSFVPGRDTSLSAAEFARIRVNAPKIRSETSFSTSWALGGPIIERERIAVWYGDGKWCAMHPAETGTAWYEKGAIDANQFDGFGCDTPLIAAMRAYVASKFGDNVGTS